MPSILLSDNGVSSGSAGLKTTAASDGSLALQTTTAGGAATTAVTIDTSQNVGVGVTPSAWDSAWKAAQIGNTGFIAGRNNAERFYAGSNGYFNGTNWIYTTTGRATYYASNVGQHEWYTAASGTAGNAITFTQAMTLDASGQLGLGTTSPSDTIGYGRTLDIQGGLGAVIYLRDADAPTTQYAFFAYDGNDNGLKISNQNSSGYMRFSTAGSERARIDTSGNLLVGTTTALVSASTGRLNVQATTGVSAIYASSSSSFASAVVQIGCGTNSGTGWSILEGYSANSGADQFSVARFKVLGNGNVQNTNNSYGAISDVKLKENITDATPKLEKLNQVRVVNYNLIGNETKQLGVIAQELEQVFPSMVDETPDRDSEGNDLGTTTKAVKYSVFVPMLIKAIQEQQALITQLTARLDAANL
jgi:hypothetical protein